MPTPKSERTAEIIGEKLGAAAFVLLAGVVLVALASVSGIIVSFFFPQSFAGFMTYIGLGQYSFWQFCAVISYLSVLFKLFK